ncbi:hypothetical protein [Klebsiella pneumoniae]|uniref:hypothetical protein n=1 Tax=Klebsiella pneumoniae TaxID=573 RepID=UPI0021B2DE99|nr:hypothetical protein [Klebsiella pneumoniae]
MEQQVRGSEDYVLGREIVKLFATLRDTLEEVAKASAEDAFATGLANKHSILFNVIFKQARVYFVNLLQ